jgi:hypothetical protein
MIELKRGKTYKEGESLTQSNTLYSCTEDRAPDYAKDYTAEEVAELHHTIKKSDLDKFEMKVQGGRKYWRVKYTRQVLLGSKQGTLEFRVVHDGEQWGNSEVRYDSTRRE